MKSLFARKRYISPVFVIMFFASFVLWYIAKLSYTYTTDYVAKLNIDGTRIDVACTIEGIGTNLLNHQIKFGSRMGLKLSELKYSIEYDTDSVRVIKLDPESLQNAISVKMSDIRVLSVKDIPVFPVPEKGKKE